MCACSTICLVLIVNCVGYSREAHSLLHSISLDGHALVPKLGTRQWPTDTPSDISIALGFEKERPSLKRLVLSLPRQSLEVAINLFQNGEETNGWPPLKVCVFQQRFQRKT